MLPDEKILIAKSQKGDVFAFEELIAAYQHKIFNLVYRYIGNHHDALDMTQEVIIRVYKALPGFRGDASFSTWIYHIVSNVCYDELRRRSKHREHSVDEEIITESGEIIRDLPDQSPSLESIYEDKETSEYMQELINRLPDEYRLVILLREISGFSYLEIAQQLHISIGTVKSRISRARKYMQKQMIADAEHNPEIWSLLAQRGDRE